MYCTNTLLVFLFKSSPAQTYARQVSTLLSYDKMFLVRLLVRFTHFILFYVIFCRVILGPLKKTVKPLARLLPLRASL